MNDCGHWYWEVVDDVVSCLRCGKAVEIPIGMEIRDGADAAAWRLLHEKD